MLRISKMGATIGAVMAAIAAAFLTQDHGLLIGGLVGGGIGLLVAFVASAATGSGKDH